MNKEQSQRFSSSWGSRKKNKCLNHAIRRMPVDGKHFGFHCNWLPTNTTLLGISRQMNESVQCGFKLETVSID